MKSDPRKLPELLEALVRRIGYVTVKSIGELSREGILYVADGNHGNDRPRKEEFVEDGTPFIRGRDIDKNGNIDFENCDKINEVAYHRIRKGFGKADDILFSHAGTVGKLIRVPNGAPDFVANPAVTVYRSLKPDSINQDFLFTYMHSWEFLSQVWSMTGETDIFDYISLQKQRDLLIPIPSIEQQIRMSETSTNVGKLVSHNKKVTSKLNDLCFTLFRSWFIDFDPVKAKAAGKLAYGMNEETATLFPDEFEDSELGPIPAGWRVGTISEYGKIVTGRTPSSKNPEHFDGPFPFITIPDLARNIWQEETERTISQEGAASLKRTLIPAGSVCVSCIATVGNVGITTRPSITNQQIHSIVCDMGYSSLFVYSLMTSFVPNLKFFAGGGAVVQNISKSMFGKQRVIIPPIQVVEQFTELVQPLFDNLNTLNSTAKILIETRNTLLPRIMSGELEVN